MRKIAVALLALASAWSTTGPAHAVHIATGQTCGFDSSDDPTWPGVQVGPIEGGPVTATAPGAQVQVVCTIQVNLPHHHLTDAAVATMTGTQTAQLPPTVLAYAWQPGDQVFLCTEWRVNGVAYYYDALTASFSSSSTVDCVPATALVVGPTTFHRAQKQTATI